MCFFKRNASFHKVFHDIHMTCSVLLRMTFHSFWNAFTFMPMTMTWRFFRWIIVWGHYCPTWTIETWPKSRASELSNKNSISDIINLYRSQTLRRGSASWLVSTKKSWIKFSIVVLELLGQILEVYVHKSNPQNNGPWPVYILLLTKLVKLVNLASKR